jgi:hypothetical protein
MSKLMALHAPARRADPVDHPAWCEHGACVNNLDTDAVDHKQRLSRWEAMDDDVHIEVDLAQSVEHAPWDGQWVAHSAQARPHLRNLVSDHSVPCTVQHRVPIEVEAHLNSADACGPAPELLELADLIDTAGGVR